MIAQIPQPGQPLDLQYVSDMAQSIIDLNSAISSNSYSKTYLKNQDSTSKVDRTANFSFYAAYHPVVSRTIQPGELVKFTHTFTSSFTAQPVVTITPVNVFDKPTGQDISVVITSVSQGQVDGWVKFHNGTKGEASVGINIIAIGYQGSTS